ncbi:protein disulfide-isomerase A4-like [Sycon ciliatum]|uniref:protein disulfide-isomerase A4-like n=1 Tax=Sycon ciliatum TaxID=27933 RepID=UPI0020A92D5F|eukprot:scpid49956/ scgid7275/ Protein disulfide-isomerase A4; Endoplasmic reticulum resident protein 72
MRSVLCGLPRVACLALVVLAAQCLAELAPKDAEGVFELDHNTFEETVKSKDVVVVYFYTTWCEKCAEFQSNWTQVLKGTSDLENVAFAKLNAQDAQSLAEQYQIGSFPNLVTFRDGVEYPYDSKDYSAEGIIASVQRYASSSWSKPDQYSDHLTMGEFESTIKKGDGMLVKFYVRWCGHCRLMGAEWDKAARACEKLNPPMKMYQVDCEAEKDLCNENKVDSYPTLRFYRDGKIVEPYHGERKKKAFMDYLRRKTGQAAKKIDATEKRVREHITALHRNGQPAIIGFFPSEDAEALDLFEMVANEIRDKLEIVHVISADMGKKYGIEGEYGVYLSQPEHLRSKYEEQFHALDAFSVDEKDALKSWLYTKSRPLVGHLQGHNTGVENIYWDMNVVTLYYTVDFSKEMSKATQFWRRRLVEIAKDYKEHADTLAFAVADDEAFGNLLQSMGMSDNAFDVSLAISGPEVKQHYPLEEDWDEDLFREHIDNFLAKKLEPYARSEPIPARNNGPVKIAVAKNFKELYGNADRNVIVMFYVPWCPYCREMEPMFLKAARKYVNDKNLIFIKFNIQENQLPREFEGKVEGYPTIYFRGRHSTELKKYEGGPVVQALADFADSNSKQFAHTEL